MYKSFVLAALMAASQAIRLQTNTQIETILEQETETLHADEEILQEGDEILRVDDEQTQDYEPTDDQQWTDVQDWTDDQQWTDLQDWTDDQQWTDVQDWTDDQQWTDVQDWTDDQQWTDVQEGTGLDNARIECLANPTQACVFEIFGLDDDHTSLNKIEAENAFALFFPEQYFNGEFEDAFNNLDADHDGVISAEEFAAVFRDPEEDLTVEDDFNQSLERFIAEVDENRDKVFSKEEVAAAYRAYFPKGNEDQFENVFEAVWAYLNTDFNDELSLEELEKLNGI